MAARFIERLAWGTDAGFYRLVPEDVLMPSSEEEVAGILLDARKTGKKVTFRAAGTSLSGQAVTDSLLVVCGKKWEGAEVLDGGARVRVRPGTTGGRLNEILAAYGRRFTPDPASVNAAMVGGIVMNKSGNAVCVYTAKKGEWDLTLPENTVDLFGSKIKFINGKIRLKADGTKCFMLISR